ncbi:MAG: LapA family protein [Chloroflexota bacterium]
MIFTVIVTIAITIAAVMISLQNPAIVRISLFGYLVDGPVGLLLLIALGSGVLLGILLMLPALISRSWALMRQRKQMENMAQPKKPTSTVEPEGP